METIASPKHLQHLQQHLQQQQQTQEGLHVTELQMEKMVTQPIFEEFRPIDL
jgi:type II secretory pathway component PulJ